MAKQVIDDMMREVLRKLTAEALHLTLTSKRKTISSREIQTGVRLVLKGELAKHAVSEGTKAVTKFNSNKSGGLVSERTAFAFDRAHTVLADRVANA
jgi:histone H2B